MTPAAKILTVSDSVVAGSRQDASGPALARRLRELAFDVVQTSTVADGIEPVAAELRGLTCDFSGLVLTTGGTGFGPRDMTPEATALVIERAAPGLAELVRSSSPLGALSRGVVGSVGRCLVLNLPGSPTGAVESLDAVARLLPHVLALLSGEEAPHPLVPAGQPALAHVDERGRAHMVDVSGKPPTHRLARAACRVVIPGSFDSSIPEELDALDVLGEARLAGIQGAKLTASLIPLCHPLALSTVAVDFDVAEGEVAVSATAETIERTGVEMEALTACGLAALSIVGACRAADPPPTIEDLTLWEKSGGRSGHWHRTSGPTS